MFRSFLALIALTIAVPAIASAQTAPASAPAPSASAPAAPHHHGGRYMHALHSLALTPDQQTQIRSFVRDTRTANQNADKPTRRANMQKLRGEIDGVLTPDQRAQLQRSMTQPQT